MYLELGTGLTLSCIIFTACKCHSFSAYDLVAHTTSLICCQFRVLFAALRHLDNFLFDLSDGGIIGIDFGLAFGGGAILLPVPELMPFRLTRQLTSVMQPLSSIGVFKQHMVHALDALSSRREVLLRYRQW